MGSAAVDDDLLASRERLERTMAPPAATATPGPDPPAAPTARVARWRVGERLTPPSRRDLQLKALQSSDLHPLRLATTSHANKSATSVTGSSVQGDQRAPSAATPADASGDATSTHTTEPKNREMVVLQDGDIDPLGVLSAGNAGAFASSSGASSYDALSRASAAMPASSSGSSGSDKKQLPQTVKAQWKAHTDRVLAKFETVTFKIQASMLEAHDLEHDLSHSSRGAFQSESDSSAHVLKKTRERLEELERAPRLGAASGSGAKRTSGGDATVEMTQSEYVGKLQAMERELVRAWELNEKVAALRIAIKCVKLLGDTTSSPQLYPCVYVLVTDVLDTFGALVFDRIKARASEDANALPLPTPLSDNFVSTDVNIQAKETCRNWFYKTACIRELLPRIYIEIALLKCYRFLCDGEYPQIVARLSNMIKGVGEPMVALYARVYLALCGSELLPPHDTTAVLSSVFDYFFTFSYFAQHQLECWLVRHRMTMAEYLGLHSPAVEWLMKCAAQSGSTEAFETIVAHYRAYSDNSMVLKHIVEAFGPQFYAADPLAMLTLMRTATPSQYAPCHLYSLLALQLSASPTLTTSRDGKLAFLNDAWTSITSQEDIAQYMECAAAFMKLIVAHFTHREALILLKDVVRHLNAATQAELTPKGYNLMGALIENVVYGAEDHYEFFTKLIPSGEFLTLMGMFKRESSVGVAKQVLQAFVSAEMKQSAGRGGMRLHVVGPEAAVAHTLFVICCRVHDALDSLSTVTERADATKDICAFIARLGYAQSPSRVHTDEDDEALLMLYIDCRSAFYKLEPVKTALTHHVLTLAMHVHKRARGADASRRNFIKSCLAYAHITIPSIAAAATKLELLTLAATVALVTNCLPQLDAFLKGAIVQLPDLDPRTCDDDPVDASSLSLRLDCSVSAVLDDVAVVGGPPVRQRDSTAAAHRRLLRTVGDLVRVVVYAPSLTDDDAFYFVNALRKAVMERMAWDALLASPIMRVAVAATSARVRIALDLLALFGLWGQPHLPHAIAGLDSNDVLYGGDDAFADHVHAHFSNTVEEIVRTIEAMDAVGASAADDSDCTKESAATIKREVSSSAPAVSAEVVSAQVELMLDFLNLVVPLLEYDDAAMASGPASTSAPGPDDLFASSSSSSSRRRRRSRSGAVLVRKCMAFAHAKVCALTTHAAATTDSDVRTRAAWICEYFETTRAYIAAYFATLRVHKALLSDASKQAIAAAEDALATLAVAPST